MCTVSFYSDHNKVVITSNRDEHADRPLALAPQKYLYNNTPLFFPKDPKAGGSWFVINNHNDVFVLLNGAEKKHVSHPPYRMSRGILLLDMASDKDHGQFWDNIQLDNIEPFTIIAFVQQKLFQWRWNGLQKEAKILPADVAYIWSSSTLYDTETMKQREYWLTEFLEKNGQSLTPDDLIRFHTTTHADDLENGLVINRNTRMLTKNLTQYVLENNQCILYHTDLILDATTSISLNNETLVA